MNGSEKQIKWAESIKAKMIRAINDWMNPSPFAFIAAKEGDKGEDLERGKKALEAIEKIEDASWFIDNNDFIEGIIIAEKLGC